MYVCKKTWNVAVTVYVFCTEKREAILADEFLCELQMLKIGQAVLPVMAVGWGTGALAVLYGADGLFM